MLKDIAFFAVKNIKLNKLRSFLSILWIIIGVFTIILVISIWNWVDYLIKEQLKFLNVNSLIVEPNSLKSKLKWEYLDKLLVDSKYITSWTQMMYGKSIVNYENEAKDFNVIWSNEKFLEMLNFSMKSWVFISKEDVASKAKVVVIWLWVIKQVLNWNEDIIGENISINKKKFKVIWIVDDLPSMWGFAFNDSVILPYTTAQDVVLGDAWFMILFLQITDLDNVTLAVEEVRNLIRSYNNLKKGDSDDFNVYEQKSMIQAVQMITSAISFLLIWVATIILIVSWIGIMNIMYASVAERKKEIGISRAIWATGKNIVFQFLIEAISLTIIGWIIWVILWESIIYLINQFSDIKLIRSTIWDIFASLFWIIIWIIFWIFPARRASELEIVSALE